jgi:hypothetical protein
MLPPSGRIAASCSGTSVLPGPTPPTGQLPCRAACSHSSVAGHGPRIRRAQPAVPASHRPAGRPATPAGPARRSRPCGTREKDVAGRAGERAGPLVCPVLGPGWRRVLHADRDQGHDLPGLQRPSPERAEPLTGARSVARARSSAEGHEPQPPRLPQDASERAPGLVDGRGGPRRPAPKRPRLAAEPVTRSPY